LTAHASATMTLEIYAGLFDEDLDAIATRLIAATPLSAVSGLHNSLAMPRCPAWRI